MHMPQKGANIVRKLIVGNWKMNGTMQDLPEIALIAQMARTTPAVDAALCLSATLIGPANAAVNGFDIGGQDCHAKASGAHTGCVSAQMLKDVGAKLSLIGHSERRADQGETNTDIADKAIAAHAEGLRVIICVGETAEQRDAGLATETVLSQLSASVPDIADADWVSIAYEPIWAIGTGRIPAVGDVAQMHLAIRNHLLTRFGDTATKMQILYGGSMNGDNALELLSVPNVDGGLIGGASLTAAKFQPILDAAHALSV